MPRKVAISIAQSALIIGFCAAVGFSLAHVQGANPDDGLALALGGGAIGACAFLVSLLFMPVAAETEQRSSHTTLQGTRVMVLGFGIAATGWLASVLVSGSAAYYIAAAGVFAGLAGIFLTKLGKRKSHD